MATENASIVGVATLVLIIIPGLLLNGMFLFMYGRRKRLRIPAIYFFVSLSVCNVICIFFWIGPTAVAEFEYDAHLSGAAPWHIYCQIQAVLVVFYQNLNMHTYCLLALERVLKFYKPTLHAEVFYNDIVIIMALVVMWILELVPALFHIMTWGTVIYQVEQFQCTYDDTQSTSRLNAVFMYTFIVPFLFTSICFLCVFIKYCLLKNNVGVSPGFEDNDVTEEDLTGGAGGEKRVKGGKSGQNPFGRDDDSDDEDKYNKLFAVYHEDASDKESNRVRQRIYKYRERELDFALLIFFIWLCFILLWLMYLVVMYMKAYDPTIITTPTAMPNGLETAATFLSHFTLSGLCCLYWIVNRRFRRHIRLACSCGDTPKEPKPQKVYPKPEPTYNEPTYRRNPGGPQFKNIHRGSLGEFSTNY